MLSALAFAYAASLQTPDLSRLRTLLPNGAVILVTKRPHARKLIIQLAIADKNCPETASSNGLRHLLEHLMAKGIHRDIDRKLEANGAFLSAETDRDAALFTLNLKPADLTLGLQAISEISSLGPESKEDISREAEIIREEAALEDDARKLSVAAWHTAYGDAGVDPMGDPDRLAQVTAAQIGDLHHAEFVGENVRLLIDGDVDLDDATNLAKAVLELIPQASYTPTGRGRGTAGSAEVGVEGAARAALVPSVTLMETAAALAAGLAIGSEVQGSFVTYTPTSDNGLVIVGKTGAGHDLASYIDSANPDQLYGLGRSLAKQWVLRQKDEADGTLRALMLAGNAAAHPEDVLNNLSAMSLADFRAGFDRFKAGKAVSVVGR